MEEFTEQDILVIDFCLRDMLKRCVDNYSEITEDQFSTCSDALENTLSKLPEINQNGD